MPGCCAFGCSNRPEKGYKMFYVPRGRNNEARRKTWIVRINRQNFVPSKRSCLCEAHFEPSQFEPKIPGKLRPNAVPSIFSHHVKSPPKKRRKSNSPTTDDQASTARNRSDHSYGTKSPSLYEDLLLSPGKDSKSLWQPIGTSDLAVVCSKHFTADDFKQGLKVTRLKEGAIPSVFRDYPMHRQKAKPKRKEQKSIGPAQKQSSDTKKLQELDSVPSGKILTENCGLESFSGNKKGVTGMLLMTRETSGGMLSMNEHSTESVPTEGNITDEPTENSSTPLCNRALSSGDESTSNLENPADWVASDESTSNLENPTHGAAGDESTSNLENTGHLVASDESTSNIENPDHWVASDESTSNLENPGHLVASDESTSNLKNPAHLVASDESTSNLENPGHWVPTDEEQSHKPNHVPVAINTRTLGSVMQMEIRVAEKLMKANPVPLSKTFKCIAKLNSVNISTNKVKSKKSTRDVYISTRMTLRSMEKFKKKCNALEEKYRRLKNELQLCKTNKERLKAELAKLEAHWTI